MIRVNVSDAIREIQLAKEAMKEAAQATLIAAKNMTPIKSGNARRNTKLVNNDTIVSDYPYARDIMIDGKSKQLAAGTYVSEIKQVYEQELRKRIKGR